MTTESIKIAIIGLGFVGGAMIKSFQTKISELNIGSNYNIIGYDKYKNVNSLRDCINADIVFTALPTQFDQQLCAYDNSPTEQVIDELSHNGFNKCIVIKSTVEPIFTQNIANKYPHISFIHNPEFLTARTAFDDFHNQTHVVLGKSNQCSDDYYSLLRTFYQKLYNPTISECTSTESECMKLFCNSFYAVKIQFFNELYVTAQSIGANYDTVKNLMLKNGWINPMHTQVPGPDGLPSYGGMCFPKDTCAMNEFMKKHHNYYGILSATINEHNKMRPETDHNKFPKQ